MSIGDFVGNLDGIQGPLVLIGTDTILFGDYIQKTITTRIITGGSLGSQTQTDCLVLFMLSGS